MMEIPAAVQRFLFPLLVAVACLGFLVSVMPTEHLRQVERIPHVWSPRRAETHSRSTSRETRGTPPMGRRGASQEPRASRWALMTWHEP